MALIINDKFRFVFVHIPKCAGTLVRNNLRKFDDTKGRFTGRVAEHEILGKLDYGHIPLSVLRKYFADEYNKLIEYWSFCITRDPFSRFPSSLSQRLRMYKKVHFDNLSKIQIKREVDETIKLLETYKDKELLPAELIHFQRQHSYIFDRGEQIVKKVYLVKQVNNLFDDLHIQTERSFALNSNGFKPNSTLVYRSDFLRIMHQQAWLLIPLKQFFSLKTKQRIKNSILGPPGKVHKSIFGSGYVKDFINDYYAKDIRFYQGLLEKANGS